MNFLVSFWGLLVRQVDFWGTWRDVLHRRGDSGVVDAVAWVVEGVNNAGYEVPLRAIARVIASKTGGDPVFLAREFIEEVKSRLMPMPCAVEFLRWAKEAGKVAVVSNTPCRCFPALFLEASGVAVDALITSDVLLRRKPLKPVFTHALRRIGARPHEAVYIGDGDEDLGAMGAGLLTIMVGREGGHLSFSTLCDAWSWVKANLAKD